MAQTPRARKSLSESELTSLLHTKIQTLAKKAKSTMKLLASQVPQPTPCEEKSELSKNKPTTVGVVINLNAPGYGGLPAGGISLGGPTKGPCPCEEGTTLQVTPNSGIMAPVKQGSPDTWAPVASMISNGRFATTTKPIETSEIIDTPAEVMKDLKETHEVVNDPKGTVTKIQEVLDTPKGPKPVI